MDLHEKYRLTRVINACGKMTHLAGAAVLPEIVEAVNAALPYFFDLDELQERAGEVIARATGAQWGCVTACTAAGLTLGVAASMTGKDLGKIAQLPDTTGMKDEVVLQKGHAVNFGAPITQMIRLAGARPVEVGTINGTSEHHLKHALTDRTAAVMFVVSHHTVRFGCLPLKRVVEIAHEQGIPVIVDGAAQEAMIQQIIAAGADLAVCSGHKYLSGTTAGIVAGREDLVRAVNMQNRGIGRPMKVGKEGIVGAMAALEHRMRLNLADWEAGQDRKMKRIIERLSNIPGLALTVDPDPNGNPFSRARVTVDPAQTGLTAAILNRAMADGDPSIRLRGHHVDEGYFNVDAIEMTDEEVDLTCDRLRKFLTASPQEKTRLAERYGRGRAASPRLAWLQ
ncbi:MAG: aminotransferase class V-fold PLP-dependent enzyme [Candidatus Latescibacteria bacterium]|nr:aminotransferase class V-fold PLP-dependent enzyme [Candidatus Latescibacterota bacterium]